MIYNAKIWINSYIQYINNKKYALQKKNNSFTLISYSYIRIINSKSAYTLCFLFASLQKYTKDVYTLFL